MAASALSGSLALTPNYFTVCSLDCSNLLGRQLEGVHPHLVWPDCDAEVTGSVTFIQPKMAPKRAPTSPPGSPDTPLSGRSRPPKQHGTVDQTAGLKKTDQIRAFSSCVAAMSLFALPPSEASAANPTESGASAAVALQANISTRNSTLKLASRSIISCHSWQRVCFAFSPKIEVLFTESFPALLRRRKNHEVEANRHRTHSITHPSHPASRESRGCPQCQLNEAVQPLTSRILLLDLRTAPPSQPGIEVTQLDAPLAIQSQVASELTRHIPPCLQLFLLVRNMENKNRQQLSDTLANNPPWSACKKQGSYARQPAKQFLPAQRQWPPRRSCPRRSALHYGTPVCLPRSYHTPSAGH